MAKLDYEELYTLLYNMETSKNLSKLSEKMYYSISKVSKMITYYEKKLKVQLYVKNQEYILSEEGKQILCKIKDPLKEIQQIVRRENKIVGIDENLIEDKINEGQEYEKKYINSKEIIENYKSGKLDKIIVSSEYEEEIEFCSKRIVIQKPVYRIEKKGNTNKKIFANEIGCPITRKLQKEGIKIDQYLTQSVAICKMVRQSNGSGYTFSVDTLNPEEINIEVADSL